MLVTLLLLSVFDNYERKDSFWRDGVIVDPPVIICCKFHECKDCREETKPRATCCDWDDELGYTRRACKSYQLNGSGCPEEEENDR